MPYDPATHTIALGELLARYDLDADRIGDLLAATRDRLIDDVAEIGDARDAGEQPIPDVTFDELVGDDGAARDLVRRRGCVIVRNAFEPGEAAAWDAELHDYLGRNGFDPESGAGICGIYWSKPQIALRQHARMVELRRRLNSIWNHPGAERWFDPDHDIGYADRVRRRAPGTVARGLAPHCDSPASGGWHVAENHEVFRHVLSGHPECHDPWDASFRTAPDGFSVAPADSFRTFQGWTALSEMRPDDGVLVVAPTLRAVDYLLVKGLAAEVGLFGEPTPAPRRARADEVIAPAVTRIPTVRPGDTVWWHGDLIHGVEDAANETRWSNVVYVPSSPRCPRNDAYAATMLQRFDLGHSPIDFPDEHHEADFVGRATRDDLDAVGRQQFGIDPIDPAADPSANTPAIGSAATPSVAQISSPPGLGQ